MPVLLIQDFLQTQGLKLSSDDLRIAYLTAKTVMDMGNASIDRSVLWREEDGWKKRANAAHKTARDYWCYNPTIFHSLAEIPQNAP